MVHVPSAQYHSEMSGITRENAGFMVSRMLICALMEVMSLFVLALIMKRNCGIRALYQLGFVLEMQMPFVLSTLLLWIVFTLTYRVKHLGTCIFSCHERAALIINKCCFQAENCNRFTQIPRQKLYFLKMPLFL
eukprot:jgi/Phyca11/106589/e_gw1.12.472.1